MALEMRTRRNRRQRGQGMTEYIIIVALIAIGTIAMVTVFGDNLRALFGASSNALVGQETGVEEMGGKQVNPISDAKGLDKFHELDPP